MEKGEFLKFIEDKDIQVSDDWYLHATRADVSIVKSILSEGIQAGCIRGVRGNHFNGKYYISLFKGNNKEDSLFKHFLENPKFIISGIHPYYADRSKLRMRKMFIQTRIPLRTSEWDDEYQQYLFIPPDKFVGLEYSLSYFLSNLENDSSKIRDKLKFLKSLLCCMEDMNIDLPIYDFTSHCRINKKKVFSLHL